MNVRKFCLLSGIAVLIGMTSCSKLDSPVSTTTSSLTTSQLIIPDDPDGEVTFEHKVTYGFSYDNVNALMTVALNNSSTGKYAFTSDQMKYNSVIVGNFATNSFGPGQGRTSSGAPVSGIEGYVTSQYYYYTTVPELYPGIMLKMPQTLVMQAQLDGVTIKTFSRDTYYRGTTTTSYNMGPAGEQVETNDTPVYRLVLSEDMKTANVVIYNVKFSQNMPNALAAVVLEGLKVKLSHSGIEVFNSESVVPQVLMSGNLVPYPDYTFTSFTLDTVSDNLMTIECDYTVETSRDGHSVTFKGGFKGSGYLNLFKDKLITD